MGVDDVPELILSPSFVTAAAAVALDASALGASGGGWLTVPFFSPLGIGTVASVLRPGLLPDDGPSVHAMSARTAGLGRKPPSPDG